LERWSVSIVLTYLMQSESQQENVNHFKDNESNDTNDIYRLLKEFNAVTSGVEKSRISMCRNCLDHPPGVNLLLGRFKLEHVR
jgi:predicted aldo/keto reductase-like oxidoreductase